MIWRHVETCRFPKFFQKRQRKRVPQKHCLFRSVFKGIQPFPIAQGRWIPRALWPWFSSAPSAPSKACWPIVLTLVAQDDGIRHKQMRLWAGGLMEALFQRPGVGSGFVFVNSLSGWEQISGFIAPYYVKNDLPPTKVYIKLMYTF